MKIIGFQSGHDVSYCVLENGIPILHEEYERFLRKKEPIGDGLKFYFDINSFSNSHGIDDDVDYFVYGNHGTRPRGNYDNRWTTPEYTEKMNKILDKKNKKLYIIGHHQSHAAGAFYSSNFDEALIITIDGMGNEKGEGASEKWFDDCDTISARDITTAFTVWEGKDTKIKRLKVFPVNEITFGHLWDSTLKYFGMSNGYPYGSQAGTLMAMASIGDSTKWYDYCMSNFSMGKPNFNGVSNDEKNICDVAAGLQKATEDKFKEYITPFIEKYNPKNLCFSGGVSLNSVMLGKIYDWFPNVENIHCDPIPYDGGLCLGSAYYLYHHILGNPRTKWDGSPSSSLGRRYDNNIIKKTLDNYSEKIVVEKCDDDKIVDLLDEQNIISVFGGGSESGRRALGNRSILADPRSPDMKNMINDKVKHRQWFRPFAPSIIREEVKNWFDKDIDSPYMSFVLKWKEEVKDKVPAVVHLDGTARLQTVTENYNKWYYNLIKKFGEKTGVPILLNTSFNDREPIVETPEHAIDCFLKTNIDYLYFYDIGLLTSKNKLGNNK